uniref:Bm7023, isoform a n=1 Tax=Brugia malayi TaxID=6279 RepID=A0A1I9G499_BRUMA|nr:Bm7023, isoform a [Brugia malayi]
MILSTALLAILFVRKTAEQRQLMPTIRIPSIISLNPRSPINRKSTIQSQQPGQLLQRQKMQLRNFQRIIGLNHQVTKQPVSINKKFRENFATANFNSKVFQRNTTRTSVENVNTNERRGNIRKNAQPLLISTPTTLNDQFQLITLRNKSKQPQFVRLRKLHGQTFSGKMKKILDQEQIQLPLQWSNFRHRLFNSSNQLLPFVLEMNTTNRLLHLTTTKAPEPPLIQFEKNFDLESKQLKLINHNEFHQQTATLTTIAIFDDKSSATKVLPFEQQSHHVTFQNVKQNSAGKFLFQN